MEVDSGFFQQPKQATIIMVYGVRLKGYQVSQPEAPYI